MKQSVRSFSIGLFTAGIIVLVVFYFFDSSAKNATQMTTDEMISAIKEDGYYVMTESEFISASVNKDNNEQAKANQKTGQNKTDEESAVLDTEKPDNQKNEKEVKNYTIAIESGMAPSTVSDLLVEQEIIKDASLFNQFLEENDYVQRVQIGEFQLSSDMSLDEIAQAITK